MTRRGAFSLGRAKTILDQSKRFDQLAAQAAQPRDRRGRKPMQFRIASVLQSGGSTSASAGCDSVSVHRIQLLDSTFDEAVGLQDLDSKFVPLKKYYAASNPTLAVADNDTVLVEWWNNRYWIVDVLTKSCDSTSDSFSDSDSVDSGSGNGSGSGGGGGSDGNNGSGSGSGGGGSGSGGSGGDCYQCAACCIPDSLTLTLDSYERVVGGVPQSHDCKTLATFTLQPTNVWSFDGVIFGNNGGTDCSWLDGLYRLRGTLTPSVTFNSGLNRNVCELEMRLVRYHANVLSNVTPFSVKYISDLDFTCSPFSASGTTGSPDGVNFDYQINE